MATLWFMVDDLLDFARLGIRPSGIQRLTFEIYRAARALAPERVRFVRRGENARSLEPVAWSSLESAFDVAVDTAPPPGLETEATAPAPAPAWRRAAKQAADRIPERIRRPLILSAVMQAQTVLSLARAGLGAGLWSGRATLAAMRHARPPRPEPERQGSFDAEVRPGDVFLVLGSPWQHIQYDVTMRWLRDDLRLRTGIFVHDTIPVRRPEWCDLGVIRTYSTWLHAVLPVCDIVLANSRATAADVEAYAREQRIALPGPVHALPIGTGFGGAAPSEAASVAAPANLPEPGSYVLFVSTLEARKNHILLFGLWRRLIEERGEAAVPELVFAGREGWLVGDLMRQLENTAWLGGIRFVRNPGDAELRALYAGCRFTVFPSFYEGWGLPVSESLGAGKPCLCSDRTALPEAGGALARYFDPDEPNSIHAAITPLLDDPALLAAWEEQVRREFHPTPWSATAQALFDRVGALG